MSGDFLSSSVPFTADYCWPNPCDRPQVDFFALLAHSAAAARVFAVTMEPDADAESWHRTPAFESRRARLPTSQPGLGELMGVESHA